MAQRLAGVRTAEPRTNHPTGPAALSGLSGRDKVSQATGTTRDARHKRAATASKAFACRASLPASSDHADGIPGSLCALPTALPAPAFGGCAARRRERTAAEGGCGQGRGQGTEGAGNTIRVVT